jgi:hypothetical protein
MFCAIYAGFVWSFGRLDAESTLRVHAFICVRVCIYLLVYMHMDPLILFTEPILYDFL